MPDQSLPIPLEIPWKLVSTTQRLKPDPQRPDDVTISLFSYEPRLKSLEEDYPDERVIYFKVTVSMSPCPPEWPKTFSGLTDYIKQIMLENGLPVFQMILDLKVTPRPMATGGYRPYFHEAAPIRREMVQTGVIGGENFEGESDGVSVGKSASQLHETVSSKIRSKTSKAGFSPPSLTGGLSVSSQGSSTQVDSERNVNQLVETTTREAAQERRELLSHMTNVRNVLTLLNAKHIGSPHLRFTLWPQPLHLLAVDPSDPGLWLHQFLARRSSGIEGIQEFIAVGVVPRDKEFCLEAKLRWFCVLDKPPKLHIPAGFVFTPADKVEVQSYLQEVLPTGTPIEELDVDFGDQIKDNVPAKSIRPVVEYWFLQGFVVYLVFQAQEVGGNFLIKGFPNPNVGYLSYKHGYEVYLEMKRARYEEELARSPLERGKLLMHSMTLKTCFQWGPRGLVVDTQEADFNGTPMIVDHVPPPPPALPPPDTVHRKARQAVLRWNQVTARVAEQMSRLPGDAGAAFRLDEPRVMQVLLDAWADLSPDNPLNVPLAEGASLLGLSDAQRRLLETAEVRDLRGLALTLRAAPLAAARDERLAQFLSRLDENQRCLFTFQPTAYPVSADQARELRETVAQALRRAGGE